MYLSHSFLFSILPFLIVAVPLAQPPAPQPRGVVIPISKRNIDLSKVQNMVQRSVGKIQMGMATYEKNTGKRHLLSSGFKKSSKRGTATVSLTDASLWYGTVSIGTPPQDFSIEFDTGSGDFFVSSTACGGSGESCEGHKAYNSSASSTSKDLGQEFVLSYLDGSKVNGEQFTDVVTIAGLTAKVQTLGAAEGLEGFNAPGFPADGVMGLGFPSISTFGADSTFQTLISQNLLTSPIFGLKLGSSGSELTLGGVDPSFNLDTDFTWVTLSEKGYWQASFDKITVSGSSDAVVGSTQVIFDTGTRNIIGDSAGVAAIYKALDGAVSAGDGTYNIPCSFNTPISVLVGGSEVKITPDTFNLGAAPNTNNMCVGGIVAESSLTGGFWILGDVFLQNTYTAWNFGTGSIGFAPPR